MKPPPEKIMVKREVERRLTLLEEEDDAVHIEDGYEEEDERNGVFLTRTRRNAKSPNHGGEYPLSPLSVVYAENYNPNENKGWVKPIFSSIVYRLPVSLWITAIFTLRNAR